ncbi:Spy/CpxP family protein refolding chaperone [Microvirga antarctica]|uniref:Spy/CpxP family protein refolding chaperone n=1 Tax=Microvirga antarctica TaxID=2819233 RepID=UPI001B300441|nr:Spy/CpxP family protein refolding chaperone [Microvirga antarctica]
MKTFSLISAASALVVAGTAAIAQPAPPPPGGPGGPAPRPPMTRADFDSLTDARVAAIQAGLKLTPDQQKLWSPVEQALRANAGDRAQRMEQRRERGAPPAPRPDFMQQIEQRADWTTKAAASATALSTAMKPFWASLDDRQKRLLPILMRPEAAMRGRGGHRGHGPEHGGPRGHGMQR